MKEGLPDSDTKMSLDVLIMLIKRTLQWKTTVTIIKMLKKVRFCRDER